MNENQNPFFVLHQELMEQRTLIEKLIYNQKTVELPDIDKIPHKKMFGKLYFNRAELRAYIRNEGQKK